MPHRLAYFQSDSRKRVLGEPTEGMTAELHLRTPKGEGKVPRRGAHEHPVLALRVGDGSCYPQRTYTLGSKGRESGSQLAWVQTPALACSHCVTLEK